MMILQIHQTFEELAKRSKNVREKTTNITPEQAEGRRVRFAQSLGLQPTKRGDDAVNGSIPKPSRTKLPYSGNFPIEHETAHALMTPRGSTIRQYTDKLTQDTYRGKKALDADSDGKRVNDLNELYHIYHDAHTDENVARMLENHIDRRSGVNPNKVDLQAYGQVSPTAPKHSFRRIDKPQEHPYNNYWDYDNDELPDISERQHTFKPQGVKELGAAARSQAAEEIKRWDQGSTFNGQGKPVGPKGINARINARAARGGGFTR